MRQFIVHREDGDFKVVILKHKIEGTYSFVNLTKGHICPCRFDSEDDAVAELMSQVGDKSMHHYISSVSEIDILE